MKPWEANIRKVVPYTPGEQPNESGMIKLNTNENPYSPAPGVEKALKALDADTLRLYPDPTAGDLVHSIAAAIFAVLGVVTLVGTLKPEWFDFLAFN